MKDPLRGFEFEHAKLDLVAHFVDGPSSGNGVKTARRSVPKLVSEPRANGQLGTVLSDNPTSRRSDREQSSQRSLFL
jgi:hypothetical protein